ncbi:MAG TPA: hypothetical protein V6C88_14225 [Chroococcidiopsis sp.]
MQLEQTTTLEQITLNAALTLQSYLQHADASEEALTPEAIASTLCDMLSQLNSQYPDITTDFGWRPVHPADSTP